MPGTFDTIKSLADIVTVVAERVDLRRSGSGFVGLCPFHDERTPSFHVNVDRQIFKCFGCGAGGDVFTFVERTENLTPAEALVAIARKFNVERLLHGRTLAIEP